MYSSELSAEEAGLVVDGEEVMNVCVVCSPVFLSSGVDRGRADRRAAVPGDIQGGFVSCPAMCHSGGVV